MSSINKNLVSQAVTRGLLDAIDAQLGHLGDIASQDIFYQSHISSHRPQRVVNGQLLPHTVNTLRTVFQRAVTSHLLSKGKWTRVWTQGSAVINKAYLQNIRSKEAPVIADSEDELAETKPARSARSKTDQPPAQTQASSSIVIQPASHPQDASAATVQDQASTAQVQVKESEKQIPGESKSLAADTGTEYHHLHEPTKQNEGGKSAISNTAEESVQSKSTEEETGQPEMIADKESLQPEVTEQETGALTAQAANGDGEEETSKEKSKEKTDLEVLIPGSEVENLKPSRKRAAAELDTESAGVDSEGGRPSKRGKETDEREIVTLDLPGEEPKSSRTTSAAGFNNEGPPPSKKRPFADTGSEGAGLDTEEERASKRVKESEGGNTSALTSTQTAPDIQVQNVRKEYIVQEGRVIDGTRPSWALSEREYSGRVAHGAEDPRAGLPRPTVDTQEYERLVGLLQPAGQVDQGRDVDRGAERTYAQLAVKSSMQLMAGMCRDLPLHWAFENSLDPNFDALFVTKPPKDLEALYQKFLGVEDWEDTLLKRKHGPRPWRFFDVRVTQGLIAGFLHNEVFTKSVPWCIVERINAASGEHLKFGEKAMNDKGYHLDEFLKKWSFKMVMDEQFQEDVFRPYANKLATQLALTLTPHLVSSRRAQKPDEVNWGGTVSKDTNWVEDLKKLVFAALLFKEKIGTYHEISYEYTWGVPGDQLDRRAEDPVHHNINQENEIHFTLWPGLRMTPDKRYCVGPTEIKNSFVFTLVEAWKWPDDRPLQVEARQSMF